MGVLAEALAEPFYLALLDKTQQHFTYVPVVQTDRVNDQSFH